MNIKAILLGTAACAVLAAPAFAQSAAAPTDAPKKHHHHHEAMTTGSDRLELLEKRVEEQAEEIQALKQQQQAPAPEVTSTQFEALQNQVYEQQAANTNLVKNSWWSKTSITGRMYFDVTNIDQKRDGVPQSGNGTNFDIKRFYVGIDHKFDDVWSANVTTDVTYDSTTKASQIFLKKAYLQANLDDAAVIRIGSADLPWVPFVEDTYGYRYVENTLIDRTKFGTSADWGVHLLGKFADGLINYQISAVDGMGYKVIPIGGQANRSKGIDVEGRVNINYDGFILGVGGYEGYLGKNVQGSTTHHTADRFDAIAAYSADGIRLGVEYFYADNWNNVTLVPSNSAEGISGFASYQFTPEWSVFGRYDSVNPSRQAGNTQLTSLHNEYYNVGIEYTPVKIVNLALVYKHDNANNGFLADSNGTIGGLAQAPGSHGAYDEIGLFGQLRW